VFAAVGLSNDSRMDVHMSVVLSEQDRIICIVTVCEQGLSDADTCLVCTLGHDPVNGNAEQSGRQDTTLSDP